MPCWLGQTACNYCLSPVNCDHHRVLDGARHFPQARIRYLGTAWEDYREFQTLFHSARYIQYQLSVNIHEKHIWEQLGLEQKDQMYTADFSYNLRIHFTCATYQVNSNSSETGRRLGYSWLPWVVRLENPLDNRFVWGIRMVLQKKRDFQMVLLIE